MKRKCLYYLIFVFLNHPSTGFSQITNDTISANKNSVVTVKKFIVGLESGFEWEQKISNASTLSFFAGEGVGFASSDVGLSAFKTKLIFSPSVHTTYKKYYHVRSILNASKEKMNNAGNFFLFKVEAYLPVKNQNYLNILISQGWGIQRSLSKKINLELQLGITEHIFYDNPERGPYIKIHPIITILSFSYLL